MASNSYTAEYDQQQIQVIDQVFAEQQSAYQLNRYPSYEERIADLKALKQALLDNQQAFVEAMDQDFNGRSHDDSKMGDILTSIMGINYAIKHLKGWLKPEKRKVGLIFQPAKSFIHYQPLGVVGIITPWNYPLFLALGPLTAALAAGNCAMIKMSEFTPATNKVFAKVIGQVFKQDKVAVIDGGAQVAAHFSSQAFNHILFTGSTNVGSLVMSAAAKHLTPVTLELGGKSPTIIADDIEITEAVSRFILGKTLNAGQTCVAPDYILVPESKTNDLIEAIKQQFAQMYPNFTDNSDFTSIINEQQFQRLSGYLEDAKEQGASVISLAPKGQEVAAARCKMPLTLVHNVSDEMQVMKNEIFGPILPIVSYQSIEQAIDYVNQRPRPLALYLMSFDGSTQKKVLNQTHAGGVCLNESNFHVAQDDLPFGGIGPSGMGKYHGREGFLTFSHGKSVYQKGKLNTSSLIFPPFGTTIQKLIYKLFIR